MNIWANLSDLSIVMAYIFLIVIPLLAIAYIATEIIFRRYRFKKIDMKQYEEYQQFKRIQQEAEQECIEAMKQRLYDNRAKVVNLYDYRRGGNASEYI